MSESITEKDGNFSFEALEDRRSPHLVWSLLQNAVGAVACCHRVKDMLMQTARALVCGNLRDPD